jgi:hypothetical protein
MLPQDGMAMSVIEAQHFRNKGVDSGINMNDFFFRWDKLFIKKAVS